ncbi:hypothetical protein PAHAL_4G129400 [Panicum hallii]|uniref:Uncharacterized protein n=1 Tax=Panicum hallii TaxID=206008 RepID=A0A2T8JCS3_9POAL|nr:hypothetical protein PAHAL_4G129400 [Panicum hallii]
MGGGVWADQEGLAACGRAEDGGGTRARGGSVRCRGGGSGGGAQVGGETVARGREGGGAWPDGASRRWTPERASGSCGTRAGG